jgi:hypothetical protein
MAMASTNNEAFEGAKVFSATKPADRVFLGERVAAWLGEHPEHEIVDKVVTQSSDHAFHCIAITLFWRARAVA